MKVLKVVQADIADKIDTQYISEHFRHIDNVVVTFICTRDGREVEDWMEEDCRYIVISLPYKKVKKLADIKPLMLAQVKERLGLVA